MTTIAGILDHRNPAERLARLRSLCLAVRIYVSGTGEAGLQSPQGWEAV